MAAPTDTTDVPMPRILELVREYWGYDSLRPLQEEAIRAHLTGRDSLVVLPTGGGKSLCYQVPAALNGSTEVVVSPLISLMKDQVDGLRACGFPAAALHSGLSREEAQEVIREFRTGHYRLMFVSPERMLSDWFLGVCRQLNVRAFVIDEAHCVSHWGHDFRPEYRRLALLKEQFPDASVHAYTATATERVRHDIVEQLGLRDPDVLVGRFDRPNLTYRVIPRTDVENQVLEVLERHRNEAVIIYCLSRKDTERMAEGLMSAGYIAHPYHAGMNPDQRRMTQEAFAREKLNIVTATVAFGMGIDRSNVRCVIHATMPKSIEHYQQETGRAGRDGLEAECVLFYSAADAMRWESLIQKSADESGAGNEFIEAQSQLLEHMRRFASVATCRHRGLVEHFDQDYDKANCQACDVCLDETEGAEDGTVAAQKILSCVARLEERFGVGYLVEVLAGADTETVRQRGHDSLSTYGLMKETPRKNVMNWVYQLLDQGLLSRTTDDKPVLKLNGASWEVMRGQRTVKLLRPKAGPVRKTAGEVESWEGVDRSLFDQLREVRRELADERGVPAFVVFGDKTLRELARIRPTTSSALGGIFGIGQTKRKQYGRRIVAEIRRYCDRHNLRGAVRRGQEPPEE